MIEKEISVQTGDVRLVGTLCLPGHGGGFPTALLIQGSGPLDRNSNSAGQALNITNALAHRLAQCGIASLRVDKRGVGSSDGSFLSAGLSTFVDDGLHWLQVLSHSSDTDSERLFIIGHSEGALIAPQLSEQFPKLAGIVLLCPSIEEPSSLLLRQAEVWRASLRRQSWFRRPLEKLVALFFDPVKAQQKLVAQTPAGIQVSSRFWRSKLPLTWLQEYLALDPPELFRRSRCRTLALGAGNDFQCVAEDVYAIGEVVGGEYECHVFEKMTHILRNDESNAGLFG